MGSYEYDLIVIGGGSGGVRAARMASQNGARVALVEQGRLGGTCVNVGCVPKKLFSYAAHFATAFDQCQGYGWNVQSRFDWSTLRDNTTREIERLNGIYANLLEKANITLFNAHASIIGPHTVSIDGQEASAERILIATGGKPRLLDFPGAELMLISDQMFSLPELPKRLAVYGGGYIAVEFASIMHGLGVDTHLVYRGDLFLRGFDREVREFIRDTMMEQGIKLHFGHSISRIEEAEDGQRVMLDDESEFSVDCVLGAIGRVPNHDGLGLENISIEFDESGLISIDDAYRTTTPSVLALGDVIDTPALTPVAIAEAMRMVAIHYEGKHPHAIDYDMVATAVFTHPNIATVGYSEEQARARYGDVRIYTSSFRPLLHTLAGDSERCFMKLVVDDASDKVVGAHMVGADAGELIQGVAIAVKAGLTKTDFDSTIGIHPTSAEEMVTMRNITRR